MAVLISTPYMDEAERCHRVGLVHRGRLLLEGEPTTLLGDFERAGHPRPSFEELFIDAIGRVGVTAPGEPPSRCAT